MKRQGGKIRKILKLNERKRFVVCEEKIVKVAKSRREQWSRLSSFLSLSLELGFVISLPIAGGAVLGRWLDQRFGLAPKMTLSFIFLGVFLAVGSLYQIIKSTSKKQL